MRPIDFDSLCAIAKLALLRDRTIDDGEWVARIKDRLIAQGWDYPDNYEMFTRVIRAVERVVPRPLPPALRTEPKRREVLSHNEDFTRQHAAEVYRDLERRAKERNR